MNHFVKSMCTENQRTLLCMKSINHFSEFLVSYRCVHAVSQFFLSYTHILFSASAQPDFSQSVLFPFYFMLDVGWGVHPLALSRNQKQALSMDVLPTSFVLLLLSLLLSCHLVKAPLHSTIILPVYNPYFSQFLLYPACPVYHPFPTAPLLLLHKLPVIDSGHIAFVCCVLVCLWEPQQPGPSLNEPATKTH